MPFATNNYNLSFLGNYPNFLIILGWTIVLLELMYPIFIWQKKTRNYWIFLIILLHVSIAYILNLYFFSAIMIIWNITLKLTFNKAAD